MSVREDADSVEAVPERGALRTARLDGVGDLKRPLTPNMESLESALPWFGPALAQCCFTVLLFSFWNGSVHSVPLYVEECNLPFDFTGVPVKRAPSLRRDWTSMKP